MVAVDAGEVASSKNRAGSRVDKRELNKIKELDTGSWNFWALQSKAIFDDVGLFNVIADPYPTLARARVVVACDVRSFSRY